MALSLLVFIPQSHTERIMRAQISCYSEQRNLRLGLVFAFGGTALFALKSIFIKLAYAQGVDTVILPSKPYSPLF